MVKIIMEYEQILREKGGTMTTGMIALVNEEELRGANCEVIESTSLH